MPWCLIEDLWTGLVKQSEISLRVCPMVDQSHFGGYPHMPEIFRAQIEADKFLN